MLPLAILLGLFAYIVVPLMDKLTLRWSVRDLDNRSQLLAATLQVPLREDVLLNDKAHIKKLFDGAIEDERLFALGFCDPAGKLLYKTDDLPAIAGLLRTSRPTAASENRWCNCRSGPVHVADTPGRGRRHGPGPADPGARHELHRAPQRRHQEVRR